jgi:hypothetical protein
LQMRTPQSTSLRRCLQSQEEHSCWSRPCTCTSASMQADKANEAHLQCHTTPFTSATSCCMIPAKPARAQLLEQASKCAHAGTCQQRLSSTHLPRVYERIPTVLHCWPLRLCVPPPWWAVLRMASNLSAGRETWIVVTDAWGHTTHHQQHRTAQPSRRSRAMLPRLCSAPGARHAMAPASLATCCCRGCVEHSSPL